jgi:hypothetical protein
VLGQPEHRAVQDGSCPRCGYLGWAPAAGVTETLRRALRESPVERRRESRTLRLAG